MLDAERMYLMERRKWMLFLLVLAVLLSGCGRRSEPNDDVEDLKPVIYLYPEKETEVTIRLDYRGTLTVTYPEYRNGWHVLAEPDGTITDMKDGKAYSYLFWEGESSAEYDFSKGFCVPGDETAVFLQEHLAEMGLKPEEYNEMIVFWLPRMQENAYNLISFQEETYTKNAELSISPEPDSVLRVFMAYKALEEPVGIEPQPVTPFERTGFCVVEWGGAEVR